ncbi:MAG: hypothetical protein A2Y62_00955 [Candidatus Fischerbacteria bacterium RBG_13_37_8]|uniref:Uncharacterized protein n=1 Tax=Candidatus Fischerbacteria bacterium RBG_13_37_8 TaxID=1817863 RepID=A0A1F5VVH4_9BACT|nr:MAG: hypothetical protein A2Y62_00955 [Candidatus Fischerbacteria bacterium RBG_13_37_8]
MPDAIAEEDMMRGSEVTASRFSNLFNDVVESFNEISRVEVFSNIFRDSLKIMQYYTAIVSIFPCSN